MTINPDNREPLYPELESMAHAVERVFVNHPPEDRAMAIVAGARVMRDYQRPDCTLCDDTGTVTETEPCGDGPVTHRYPCDCAAAGGEED